jgi:hypothetical protein
MAVKRRSISQGIGLLLMSAGLAVPVGASGHPAEVPALPGVSSSTAPTQADPLEPARALVRVQEMTAAAREETSQMLTALRSCSPICVRELQNTVNGLMSGVLAELQRIPSCVEAGCADSVRQGAQDVRDRLSAARQVQTGCAATRCAQEVAELIAERVPAPSETSGEGADLCLLHPCVPDVLAILVLPEIEPDVQNLLGTVETCSLAACLEVVQREVERVTGTVVVPEPIVEAVLGLANGVCDSEVTMTRSDLDTSRVQTCLAKVMAIVEGARQDAYGLVGSTCGSDITLTKRSGAPDLDAPVLAAMQPCIDRLFTAIDSTVATVEAVRSVSCPAVTGAVQTARLSANTAYTQTKARTEGAGLMHGTPASYPERSLKGTVTTQDGEPFTDGTVVVTLSPGWYLWSLGGGVDETVLAVEPIGTDGIIDMALLVPPEVLDAAADGRGLVNASFDIYGEELSYHQNMAFRLITLPDGESMLQPVTPGSGPLAISMAPGAPGVHCTPDGTPASDAAAGPATNLAPPSGRCVEHHTERHYRMTAVQEIHTSADMTARAVYANEEHEESDVSAVVKPPGGSFELGAMTSLRKTVGWDVVQPLVGASTATFLTMKSGFLHQGDYRWVNGTKDGQSCSDAEMYTPTGVLPTSEFVPAARGHDGNCKTFESANRERLQPDMSVRRFKGKAQVIEGAGSMIIGYKARSGYSTNVWTRWRAGKQHNRYWICGWPGEFDTWEVLWAGPVS